MDKLSVLVVDDAPADKRYLIELVNATGVAVCEGTASTGLLALEQLRKKRFDCVLLDVRMPELTGVECLKRIKANLADMPVIMAGEAGGDSSDQIVAALQYGLFDFIVKPATADRAREFEALSTHLRLLFTQVQALHRSRMLSLREGAAAAEFAAAAARDSGVARRIHAQPFDLLLIASSTGGPKALETIITKLPEHIQVPILSVQHMPPLYTRTLADSLNGKSRIQVMEAVDGQPLQPGVMLIAPGGRHMRVKEKPGASSALPRYCVVMDDGPAVNGVRPAADVLFESVAQTWPGAKVITVVLTGMGSDGVNGLRQLKQRCDCSCMTQSRTPCVVYGMPRSVCDAGLSDETVDLPDIAGRIVELVLGKKNG
ncbi:MAG: chemotaxis-specific protein-glutamate methyltransferase CheB [Solirubrobacterales bacterium]